MILDWYFTRSAIFCDHFFLFCAGSSLAPSSFSFLNLQHVGGYMLRTIGMTISSQGFHFLDNVIGLGGQINLQILNPRPGF